MSVTTLTDQIVLTTDSVGDADPRRVFPIFADEVDPFREAIPLVLPRDGAVLDIGTGSGVLAILAALASGRVLATDINPRALAYAKKNTEQTGVSERVQLLSSDLFAALDSPTFNLIMSNPPFAAIPPGCPWHISGDGGADGLRISRNILSDASRYLKPAGALLLLAMSPVRRDEPVIVSLTREIFAPSDYIIDFVEPYGDRIALRNYCQAFSQIASAATWYQGLDAQEYTHFAYGLLTVRPRHPAVPTASTDVILPPVECSDERYSGSWQGRLRRYKYWLSLLGV